MHPTFFANGIKQGNKYRKQEGEANNANDRIVDMLRLYECVNDYRQPNYKKR